MRGRALDASLGWEESRFPEAHFHQGTTTPSAVPEVGAGAAAGKCSGRLGTMDFPGILREVVEVLPDGLDLRPVMDNHEMHGTGKVGKWPSRCRHRHVHFTSTSTARLDRIELWFAELTGKRLQRCVHRPVAERDADVMSFTGAHNGKPKPCWWVRSADGTIGSVRRFRPKTGAVDDV